MSIVCFTGHRPDKLGSYIINNPTAMWVKAQLLEKCRHLILEKNARHFICGMALGVDLWGAATILKLKEKFQGLILEAAVPFEGYDAVWRKESKNIASIILSRCDVKTYVSPPGYTNEKMRKRNIYMVDKSDIVLTVWDGSIGGTGATVRYAMQKKKEIIRINPTDFTGEITTKPMTQKELCNVSEIM